MCTRGRKMNRRSWSLLACLVVAGGAIAQPKQQPADKDPPAVVELFEDNAAFFIEHLHNHGAPDGTIIEKNDQSFFSGTCSLAVTEFQKFNTQLPGWNYKIVENPQPGQYRYLRFAWKRTEAPGIMLQLHARTSAWHRSYTGKISQQT